MQKAGWVVNFLGIVCFLYAAVSNAAGQELIFSDDFEKELISDAWNLDSPHSWKVEEGALITTKYGGGAYIKGDLGESFIVEARIKALEPNPELEGGFGGANIFGINFVIRPDGFWWPYRRPGDERSMGGLKKTGIDLNRWYNFRIIRRSGGVFEWFVDGEKICELFEPAMKGGIGFHAHRFKMAYDSIRVYKIEEEAKQESESINVLKNSSFETIQDSIPLYWAPTTRLPYITYGSMENFFRQWRVDTEEKFEGVNSVRMENEGGLQSWYFGVERGEPYVFSVYLKSDREDVPVKLTIWEWNIGRMHTNEVKVGKNWERYESVIKETTTGNLRVRVELQGEGALWVDAVQLEKGKTSTSYRINPLDRVKGTEKIIVELPETHIKKVSGPFEIDGRLDDAGWSLASQTPRFLISTRDGNRKSPSEKTEGFICYDDVNLYIGFRCWDSQIENLKATIKEDGGPVWTDDCVEVFIDVNLGRATYYQFAVNALGTKFIQDKVRNIPWVKDWHAAGHIDKKYWTVEIAVPLAALGIDNLTSERWGINLARENHKVDEYTCTAPVSYLNFHDVQRYGFLTWSDRNVFAKHLYQFEDLALKVDESSGQYVLDGIVRNFTGKDAEIIIEGKIDDVKHSSGKIKIGADGSERMNFGKYPVKEDEKVVYSTISIIDSRSREMLKVENRFIKISPLIETVLERSYYTTEENAKLLYAFNIDRKYLKGKKVNFKIRDGRNILSEKNVVWKEEVDEILMPIGALPVGEYLVEASLVDGMREAAKSSQVLRKLAPGESEAKIDRQRRVILVDEEPFFVFAPMESFQFAQSGFYREGWEKTIERIMKHWADHGFKSLNVVSHFTPFATTEKGWAKLFEIAARYGVKIVAWPVFLPVRHMERIQEFEEFIRRFKNERSLLAWLVVDEPEIQANVTPEMVIKVVDITRKSDPYHPVYVNFTYLGPAQRWGGIPGDIISTDLYITGGEGRSIKEIIDLVRLKKDIAKERGLLTWMFLVGNNLHNHRREPTPEEQESQTYGALVSGCTGLKYFDGQPVGKGHWERYQRLNRELQQLTPVIFSPEKTGEAQVSSPSVLVMTRKYKGNVYLISVNIEDRETNVAFDLSGLTDREVRNAEVLFEDRILQVKNKLLEDTFKPFQRHVYKINGVF